MVYKVNRSGLQLFNQLRQAYRNCFRELRSFRSADFRREDVERFVDYLRDQAIWEPRRGLRPLGVDPQRPG